MGEPAAPNRRPTGRRTVAILCIVGVLLVGVVCVAAVSLLGSCRDTPPPDVLDPLPRAADVLANDVGPGCSRMIDLGAHQTDPAVVRAQLLAGLKARGWRLSDGVRGTMGVLPDGSRTRYWLRLSEQPQLALVVHPGPVPVDEPSVGPPPAPAMAPFSLAQPRFASGQIIALANDGLQAYDPTVGSPTWSSSVCDNPRWAAPFGSQPLDVVVVGCGDTIRGVSAVDGSETWSIKRPANDLIRTGGDAVTFASVTGVDAVRSKDGRQLLSDDTGSTDAASDPSGIFTAGNPGVRAFAMDGSPRWTYGTGTVSVLADGDLVFARTKELQLVALDAATGAPRWTSEASGALLDQSLVAGVNEHVVMTYRWDDPMQVAVFDRASGRLLWQRIASAGDELVPALGDDVVVITQTPKRGTGQAIVVDDRTGEELHRYGSLRPGHAAVAGGQLAFFATVDGTPQLEVHDAR